MASSRDAWRDRLTAELTGETDRSLHLLRAAKVIQDALAAAGMELVVVGGSAVTAYDPGAYTSYDIDLVGAALNAQLDGVLRGQLGFRVEGRTWYDEELKIVVERPGSTLEPTGAQSTTIEVDGVGPIIVIAIEDLICDRLESWAATGHYDSWAQAVRLVRSPVTDVRRLDDRCQKLDLALYLAFARWLEAEVQAGRGARTEVAEYVRCVRDAADLDALTAQVLEDRAALLAADEE